MNVQISVENPLTTQMVIMARYAKMPIVKTCDFVKIVSKIERNDEEKREFFDWHITSELVNNRSGDWFFGVACIG